MDPNENPPQDQGVVKRKQLTEHERLILVIQYLRLSEGGTRKLPPGAMRQLATDYQRSPQHIRKLYIDVMAQLDQGILFPTMATINAIPRGPESDLDEYLAECLFEFNSTEGYLLPIREFTQKFDLNRLMEKLECFQLRIGL